MNNTNGTLLFDKTVFNLYPEQIEINSEALISTINFYSSKDEKDKQFKVALSNCDTKPFTKSNLFSASKVSAQKTRKSAGSNSLQYLVTNLNIVSGKCFHLGSTEHSSKNIKEMLPSEYQNIITCLYSPTSNLHITVSKNVEVIENINATKPEALFFVKIITRQEKCICMHRSQLNTKVIGLISEPSYSQ